QRRFAINVLAQSQRLTGVQLMRMRRRQTAKAEVLGLAVLVDQLGIPYLKDCLQVIFCEVEKEIPSGDRSLFVARVIESRANSKYASERPLLFSEVTTPTRFPKVRQFARTVMVTTGGLDMLKKTMVRFRPPPPADI